MSNVKRLEARTEQKSARLERIALAVQVYWRRKEWALNSASSFLVAPHEWSAPAQARSKANVSQSVGPLLRKGSTSAPGETSSNGLTNPYLTQSRAQPSRFTSISMKEQTQFMYNSLAQTRSFLATIPRRTIGRAPRPSLRERMFLRFHFQRAAPIGESGSRRAQRW